MKPAENILNFIEELRTSFDNGSFVKATLGNYRGSDLHLQKLIIRPIETKKGLRLSIIERARKRDTARTETIEDAIESFKRVIGTEFFSGHLFTTESDFQLGVGKKGKAKISKGKPTFTVPPDLNHDRKKTNAIDQSSFFLKALGITDEKLNVVSSKRDKWKQINKLVEVVKPLIEAAKLDDLDEVRVKDMGCGKGYLTFAIYQYLSDSFDKKIFVEGIDTNPDLTSLCNQIAESCGFEGLTFKTATIADTNVEDADIVIALHACDTATDEAIFKGIDTNAQIIVTSPCCHQEIRPQIKPPSEFEETLKHGSLLENHAEFLTDALRALILQSNGYETKVFDFVPTAHTPKNKLITATRSRKTKPADQFISKVNAIKDRYEIRSFTLENLLNSRNN